MLCPDCQRPMRLLFTSYACDHCDGLAPSDLQRGYIVLESTTKLGRSPFYVFRTRTDAALWRSAQELQHCPVVEVLTECEVSWRVTSGTLEGVELADKQFLIYPDHRFPPGPNRAFLAPTTAIPVAA